jgi:hypothetical protein
MMTEIEFVGASDEIPDATPTAAQDALFRALGHVPGVLVYRQNVSPRQVSMTVLVFAGSGRGAGGLRHKERAVTNKVARLALKHKVAIFSVSKVPDDLGADVVVLVLTHRMQGLKDYAITAPR